MLVDSVLFDLDGTLLDTAPDLTSAVNQLLLNRGLKPMLAAEMRPYIARGTHTILKKAFGMNEDHAEFMALKDEFLAEYQKSLTANTQLFDGIASVLDYLDGIEMPWGVVTSKSIRFAKPLLDHFKLLSRSKCLVGGDNLQLRKPNPDPLYYACELIKCDPTRCLYVGDSKDDFMAARAAGMKIFIAEYGYLQVDDDYHAWQADGIVQTPLDIITLLK